MKKILNILSGFSLSVSLPLTLVACNSNTNNGSNTIPEQVITPIKKFKSFKDFLKANTFLWKEDGYEPHYNSGPQVILDSSLAQNNFKIYDNGSDDAVYKEFSNRLVSNLNTNNSSVENILKVQSGGTIEYPPENDFVDANGEKVFLKLKKLIEENLEEGKVPWWPDYEEYYGFLMPKTWDWFGNPGEQKEKLSIITYADKMAADTYYNFNYIKFEAINSSWLWDLKPESENGSEVIYMGNDNKEIGIDLKPYEDTCDMPWLANNQWCKEE